MPTPPSDSTSPRLDHVRANDVDLYELNGGAHVRANGKGISLLTESAEANGNQGP
jgi:hypothetical protein